MTVKIAGKIHRHAKWSGGVALTMPDLMSCIKHGLRQMAANKAGSATDQDFHVKSANAGQRHDAV